MVHLYPPIMQGEAQIVSFSLREMSPEDSPALASLITQSPDGGKITFSPRYHLPAFEVYAARHGEMIGVVVEAPDVKGLVGAAHMSFGTCQFEGALRSYALLSGLVVRPDFRRQGIATALAQWRVERAVERSGSETMILADIQAGNTGSTANAKKWANQITGHLVTVPMTMRGKPPHTNSQISVREANSGDLEVIAQNLNTFYEDYNFFRPQTPHNLRAWLGKTPFSQPINHYFVATDSANRLLAGIGIAEEWRLMSLYIEKVPPFIQFANLLLKVIPPDKEMRALQTDMFWFAPGQLEAARQLWQTVRWEWRDRGSSLLANFDPRSPIRQMIQPPAWLPTTSVSLALRAPVPMTEARLLVSLL